MPWETASACYTGCPDRITDHMTFFADWLQLVVMADQELEEFGFSTTVGKI